MSSYRPTLTFCFIILGCMFLSAVFTDAAEVSKCYQVNSVQYCFYSGGTMSSWDAAREFCEGKNSTLPITRDENIDRVFQQFLDDSYDVTRGRPVWVSARARPVNNSVTWHWINGSPSALDAYIHYHSSSNWWAAIGTSYGGPLLYSSSRTDAYNFICQYNYDRNTTSTSSVSCSPRWIVHNQSAAHGAPQVYATSQQQCLDRCVADTRCLAAEWSRQPGCYHHRNRGYRHRYHNTAVTQFEIIRQCNPMSDSRCNNTFVHNSQCYKVHSTERIPWFTAVNRCLSNNASLAVFDDNVLQYFPSSVLPDKAWIGLLKSFWTWPDGSDVLYNKINPPPHPNSNYSCVVAAADQWRVSSCDDQYLVTCQSDFLIPVTTTTTTTTTSTTTVATTTVTETTTTTEDVGLVVGIVVAVLLILVVVVVVVVVVLRRRRRSRPSSNQNQPLEHQIQQRHSGGGRETENIYMNGGPECVYASVVPSSQPTASDDRVTPADANGELIYSDLTGSGVGNHNPRPTENETVYANVL